MTEAATRNRIQILELNIREAQFEVKKLKGNLMDTMSFRDKFIYWYENDDRDINDSIPSVGFVRDYLDRTNRLEMARGVYYMCEDGNFERYLHKDYCEDVSDLEADELFMATCKTLMEEDYDAFEVDW